MNNMQTYHVVLCQQFSFSLDTIRVPKRFGYGKFIPQNRLKTTHIDVHAIYWRNDIMETKTRVLIADIDEDFRRLITDVLSQEEDMECLGGADNGVDALALTAELHPDVIVLDLSLIHI